MHGGSLIFSAFGYDRDTLAVKAVEKKPTVRLREGGAIRLLEVSVNDYKPQTLIKEAVKRIPENFRTDTVIGTWFYRDVRQLNDSLYLFDEMVFDALRVGYDKHHTIKRTNNNWKHPDARPIESNYKSILFSRLLVNDTAYVNQVTGGTANSYLKYSDNDVLYDPVEIPNTTRPLSSAKRMVNSWDYYTMQQFTDADGTDYYLVTMASSTKFLGVTFDTVRVTVRRSDLAITRIENYSVGMISDFFWPLDKMMKKIGVDSLGFFNHNIYNYSEVDGKMTLTSFTKHSEPTYFYATGRYGEREQWGRCDAQCILTTQRRGDASFLDSNNIQTPVRIDVSKRQAGELRYDEAFWEQYNYIPLEAALRRKVNARLEKE